MASDRCYAEKIEILKQKVQAMLHVRAENSCSGTGAPSPIWLEVVSVFEYLLELSPDSLKNIRFHTGLINGTAWEYWHPYPAVDPLAEVNRLGYVHMISGIPERFWATEPPTPGIPRPLGINYKDRIVNSNIARFQNCMSILYYSGAMAFIDENDEKQLLVEIGGGYGGLTHCLGAGFGTKATCIIVDLPEMLLISGAFLIANNPDKKIWIYDEREAHGSNFFQNILESDFVLLPNFVAKRLSEVKDIAVIVNIQSFQEMSNDQVIEYLDLAVEKLSFCLYSDNLDCHPHNGSLSSVSSLLEQRFLLNPAPRKYIDLFNGIDIKSYICYKKYIGQPQGVTTKASPIPEHLFIPQGLSRVKLRKRLAPIETLMRRLL